MEQIYMQDTEQIYMQQIYMHKIDKTTDIYGTKVIVIIFYNH
jgi:hypothetical protein